MKSVCVSRDKTCTTIKKTKEYFSDDIKGTVYSQIFLLIFFEKKIRVVHICTDLLRTAHTCKDLLSTYTRLARTFPDFLRLAQIF